jgi:hypothetical protein
MVGSAVEMIVTSRAESAVAMMRPVMMSGLLRATALPSGGSLLAGVPSITSSARSVPKITPL